LRQSSGRREFPLMNEMAVKKTELINKISLIPEQKHEEASDVTPRLIGRSEIKGGIYAEADNG